MLVLPSLLMKSVPPSEKLTDSGEHHGALQPERPALSSPGAAVTLSAMHTPGTGRQCGSTVSLSPATLEWPSGDKQMREMDQENKSRREGRGASTTNV